MHEWTDRRRGGRARAPGGRGRWAVALAGAALLLGVRYAPVAQLAPLRRQVALLSGSDRWPWGLQARAVALERRLLRVLRWPPVSGGVTVVAVPAPRPRLEMPVAGAVMAAYGPGTDPLTGRPGVMPGILVRTAAHAPVRAPAAGRVRSVAPAPPLGERLSLEVAPGLVTVLEGVAGVKVRPGQRVSAGEVVAEVPAAGVGSVPHLLVVVEHDGRPVDPLSPLYYGPP